MAGIYSRKKLDDIRISTDFDWPINLSGAATISVILLHLRLRAAVDLDDLHGEDQAAGDAAAVAVGQLGRDVHLPLVA